MRATLEHLHSESLDQRGVERAHRRLIKSGAVSRHDLVPAVEQAMHQLRDAAPDR
jgi:hypothetical protein